jgi:hypothetical protein
MAAGFTALALSVPLRRALHFAHLPRCAAAMRLSRTVYVGLSLIEGSASQKACAERFT